MAQVHTSRRTVPVLVGAALSFLPALDALSEALRRRRIRRSFGRMPDAMLRDIGLTRYELEVALSLPLRESASDTLAQATDREAGRW